MLRCIELNFSIQVDREASMRSAWIKVYSDVAGRIESWIENLLLDDKEQMHVTALEQVKSDPISSAR
jgi:hypothetical protein